MNQWDPTFSQRIIYEKSTEEGDPAATEKRMGRRSIRHRHLSQRLPTNQRASQREERLVDVGPLVIPHAQTAKLIEPGKRPLHDPPPPAQSTPVRGATHCEPRHDKEDLDIMRELMEAGKVTLVSDRLYRLNEVAEAVRYLAERHARGKVVITTIVGGIAL
jgi:hypothetical protein